MYCLTRTHGRARGGSSKILDAVAAKEPGGSNLTLNYFWLGMISLAWAAHAAAAGATAPSFGTALVPGEQSAALHGVVLPDAVHDVAFAEFMNLPWSAQLGAVVEPSTNMCVQPHFACA